jgi:streptogramin lyase
VLLALAVWATAALTAGSAPSLAAPLGEVHELPLPSGVIAASIAAGPEGDMWFSEPESMAIGRITPGGTITEFKGLKGAPDGIALGLEGDMWFAEPGPHMAIGRITPAGEITEFGEGLNNHPYDIARGPEGNMWFTTPHSVGRITPVGQITEYKKGVFGSPGSITAGADGDLWFTIESAEPAIDRVTPGGEITEFPIEHKWLKPVAIAQAADGAVAFAAWGDNGGGVEESVIGMVTPTGTMFLSEEEPYGAIPAGIATGPEGDLWFTGESEPGKPSAVGRLAGDVKPEEFPGGHPHYFRSGLEEELEPESIAPGPEGSMWFTNKGKIPAIRWIGTGAPAAAKESPLVSGPGSVGATLTCESPAWNNWAEQQPSLSAFVFDGYTWLLEGSAIAGQTSQSFSPTAADAGHSVSCSVTASYPLLSVTVTATSPPVKIVEVASAAPGPGGTPPTSALKLPHQTDTVTSKGTLHLTLDCSGAPCSGTVKLIYKTEQTTGKGRHKKTKSVAVTIATGTFSALALGTDKLSLKLSSHGLSLLKAHRYKLSAGVSVSYATAATKASVAGTVTLAGTKPKPKRR